MTHRPRVLVTGGAGLIGAILRERIADRYQLTALDRRPAPGAASVVADVQDLEALTAAFAGHDAVVHLAADSSEVAPWESVLPNNIVATYNVFEAARRAGVGRVVFASSNHAHGGFYAVEPWRSVCEGRFDGLTPGGYPLIDEATPIRPDGLYGVSKAFGEAVGSTYADLHGVSSIHLRIGWVRADDDPGATPYASAVWLSQRDAVQLIQLSLDAPASLRYGVYFATSDNVWKVFSIAKAKRELGYAPQDAAPAWAPR